MHLGRAVGREGGIVSVDLGGPEHLRAVRGPVDGIQERPGLLTCLLEQRFQCGKVLPGLAGNAGQDRDL
jgi:hypothetical protein